MIPSASLIIDFETLDTAPSAVITQIGAIAVDRHTMTTAERFERIPHAIPQLTMGRTYSMDTVDWMTRKQLIPGKPSDCTIKDAMQDLHAFIARHKPYRIWAWGKDFERPLFEHVSKQLGITIPDYQFKIFTCGRDIWQHAFGMEKKPKDRTHHAIQDCVDELTDIKTALESLNLTHSF